MTLYRSVLIWLALAVLGALGAQWLLTDPGYVLVRYRGTDYSTTVAAGICLLLALGFLLVLASTLLRLPFRLWRRYRRRRQHACLIDGLAAYLQDDLPRAERLLRLAAEREDCRAVATAFAERAAATETSKQAQSGTAQSALQPDA